MVFLTALAASTAGLGYAMRSLPIGTAYAVWVGIGAALTVAFGMATGADPANPVRVLLRGCTVVTATWPNRTTTASRANLSP